MNVTEAPVFLITPTEVNWNSETAQGPCMKTHKRSLFDVGGVNTLRPRQMDAIRQTTF